MNFLKKYIILLLALLLLSVSFCNTSYNGSLAGKSFPFDLSKPDIRINMPHALTEISGIAWYRSDTILCIQDENARIYFNSLPSGKTVRHLDFGKNGDFEDIAVIKDVIYVIRSDGKIFEVNNFNTGSFDVKEYKTSLSSKNNTEGLAWDIISNSLLIACKGSASSGNTKIEHKKAIYRFDPEQKQLVNAPAYIIDLKNPMDYSSPVIYNELAGIEKKNQIKIGFHPSGISVHPLTGELYILSNRLLIVLNRSGKISNFSFLNPEIFRQPEGICFSPAGDLYISSEGAGSYGYILKFSALKTN